MKKKILSLGDIHGRSIWKQLAYGSIYDYETWRTAVDNGAPGISDLWNDMPFMQYDLIIFIGDYVDSFNVSNTEMLHNLKDIIHFKKALGDKVVLLIGNHDVQYMLPNLICSGYRGEMRIDLGMLFNDNLSLFKMAHEEIGEDGSKWIWTHAGVTEGWYNEVLLHRLKNPNHRFAKAIVEHDLDNQSIASNLNFAWEMKSDLLFTVDAYSGGISKWAGPIWVRPAMLNYHRIDGLNQVVGHTPQRFIKVVNQDDEGRMFIGCNHYFIDCLEHGDEKAFKLEI